MRSLITVITCFWITFSAIAQGTLLWKNTIAPTAPIYEADGTTLLSGAMYLVDLYYGAVGADPSTFSSLGLTTPFGTGAAAGYFDAGEVAIPGYAPGSQVQIQARAWRAADAATWYAASQNPYAHFSRLCPLHPLPIAIITLGGGGSAPASFSGSLLAHNLELYFIPEPSSVLIGAGGLAGLVFLRRRRN